MGESKRRKSLLGDDYGKAQETILPNVPITKQQADRFVKITSRGAWIGIGTLLAAWLTIRFVGPAFGWWQVN
ncbi:MAG: DUF2839 domain-containing protein [Limnothrix sp.]|jgi:hypothetical protein|uniref:DUF2839 domain-containing protein n=1 Tax=Limnothrix redekei LRLZ20PSL1 TaxID=3112953 RepID=A0ABW7CB61_9CYAN|nr:MULTISPECIES: DUF2839 domain-containing protein [unclassified Limnothrix]MEB3117997.1 DUF2839 domain-containing protein [Limnothrix sp.]OCQ97595.1 hypothetical protein BCR12_05030 [Limnothrix sp. P13C2]RFP58199.1 MAG: DUF2839 family protein [Limnothrix sp. CACIAM 69d]MBD2159638.1 DUF2839 domain-containing protein [Limnothrix sp. FACHB-1083]MBD2190340.1 DUF2839 domain-containing protein [Limnothrix sp. FACHB-1088]